MKSQRTLQNARNAIVPALAARKAGAAKVVAAMAAVMLLVPGLMVPAAANAPVALKFGMDINSIDPQTNAGVKPDYGLFWVGVWNLKSGWSGPDAQMDKAYAAGVTPVIQFYYWGDDISVNCLENGCWSDLHDAWKDQANWTKLAEQLVAHLNTKMKGRPAVIVVETEFNKGSVATYEPFDAQLEAKIKYFKQAYPAATLVLGFGNWAQNYWGTFDRAAAASDLTGVQAMRGSTRNSLTSYYGLVDGTLSGANALKSKFGKPVLITDVALSTYPEPEYLGHQANMTKALFSRLGELKAAGVQGIVYRTFRDNPNMDLANYYGEAERHWGFAWYSNQTWKPAMKVWVDGIKAERANPAWPTGTQPPPAAVPVGSTAAAKVEAEAFATRGAGGQQADSTASAGQLWNLWSNGQVEQPLAFAEPGVYEVLVRARGQWAQGVAPHLDVKLDGALVKAADPAAGAWQDVAAWVQVAEAGTKTLGLHFTNDLKTSSEDRNLLLDLAQVTFKGPLPHASSGNSTRAEAEDFRDRAAGQVVEDSAAAGGLAVRLATNGTIGTTLSLPEGRYSFRAVARGEAQGGAWPLLQFQLDGRPLVSRSVSTAGYRVYYADADVAGPVAHVVSLGFPNDVAPAGGEDLALVLDRIAVENLGPVANKAPVADFSAVVGGLTLRADGSASSDEDGDSLTLRWDFGDGTGAEGAVVEHTYAAAGTYTVTLTAGDGRASSSTSQQFAVEPPNHAPEPQFEATTRGLTVDVDATGTRDPDGDGLTYSWYWGDGNATLGGGLTANHTYAANGTYAIKLLVSDGELSNRSYREIVVKAPALPTPAKLVLQEGVLASPADATSQDRVTFRFTVRNDGGTAANLAQLGVAVATKELVVGPLVLQPGQTYTFSAATKLRQGSWSATAFALMDGSAQRESIAPGDAGTANPVPVTIRQAR